MPKSHVSKLYGKHGKVHAFTHHCICHHKWYMVNLRFLNLRFQFSTCYFIKEIFKKFFSCVPKHVRYRNTCGSLGEFENCLEILTQLLVLPKLPLMFLMYNHILTKAYWASFYRCTNYLNIFNIELSLFKQTIISFEITLEIINRNLLQFFHFPLCSWDIYIYNI